MKHRVLLRRALPLAVLAAVLYSAGWPASAFFFQKDEAVPTVAAMTKNGPAAEPISFSEEDFVVEGSGKLDSIVIATLPDAAVGCLTLGAQGIQVGDVIAMEAVDGASPLWPHRPAWRLSSSSPRSFPTGGAAMPSPLNSTCWPRQTARRWRKIWSSPPTKMWR